MPEKGRYDAAPNAEGAEDAGPRSAYKSPLREGRTLMKSGRYADAILRFEEALALAPNTGVLHSELSWARFHAGDLEGALVETESALQSDAVARVKGAALYTRGRVYEARQKKDLAIEAYQDSLALRNNKRTAYRLAQLKAGRIGRSGWVAAKGPFASLASFCQEEASQTLYGRREGLRCDPRPRVTLEGLSSMDSHPAVEAHLFVIRAVGEKGGMRASQLAIKLAAGWFVLPDVATGEGLGSDLGLQILSGALLVQSSEGEVLWRCELAEGKPPRCLAE